MEQVPPGYVAVGRVSTAWGARGVVKVVPLVDSPDRLARGHSVGVAGQRRTIESSRWQKGMVCIKLSGIDDREAALALRQRLLIVPESELEPLDEGQFYRFQLVDLAVESTAGAVLGRVTDVLSTGANDVYVVQGERGEILVPATDDIVKEIDLQRGRMVIEEVSGLVPERRRKR
jgi:16S rRNA processing protein RimM